MLKKIPDAFRPQRWSFFLKIIKKTKLSLYLLFSILFLVANFLMLFEYIVKIIVFHVAVDKII